MFKTLQDYCNNFEKFSKCFSPVKQARLYPRQTLGIPCCFISVFLRTAQAVARIQRRFFSKTNYDKEYFLTLRIFFRQFTGFAGNFFLLRFYFAFKFFNVYISRKLFRLYTAFFQHSAYGAVVLYVFGRY